MCVIVYKCSSAIRRKTVVRVNLGEQDIYRVLKDYYFCLLGVDQSCVLF